MPKISVIVPVYNAKKYLHQCVESILSQSFADFELLLVNDGSTDGSGAICDEYVQKDSRVRVLHKENGGVSSARNLGLDNARGEWISFVDADDWLELNMYESLYKSATEEESEIVYSDFYMNHRNKKDYYSASRYSSEKKEMMKNYIFFSWTVLWNFIAKRDLYISNNLKSPTHLCYCEDFELSVRLFHFAKKISYVNKPLYNYNRQNETSRMNNLDKKTEKDEQIAYLETIEFFREQGVVDRYEQELSWRILKSKQEMVLDSSRHEEFVEMYPTSHKYIWTCPYINKKLKVMMWLLSNNMGVILNLILKTRALLGR